MQNPSTKHCFELCSCCYRCKNKGMKAECNSCSGRHDPELRRDPQDVDDYCRCKEGILQYKTKKGQLIIKKFYTNPFKPQVKADVQSDDERDYQEYLRATRERRNEPDWDPITFYDGESTNAWLDKNSGGGS